MANDEENFQNSSDSEPVKPPKKEKKPKTEYATKEDLGEMMEMMKMVVDRMDSNSKDVPAVQAGVATDPVPMNKLSEEPEVIPVPPQWRKLVDDILGPEFGINVVYPSSGSGFMFKLIVPMDKSNASAAHKEFYKVDVRTKAIQYNEGVDGIKKFLELVKTNLSKKT